MRLPSRRRSSMPRRPSGTTAGLVHAPPPPPPVVRAPPPPPVVHAPPPPPVVHAPPPPPPVVHAPPRSGAACAAVRKTRTTTLPQVNMITARSSARPEVGPSLRFCASCALTGSRDEGIRLCLTFWSPTQMQSNSRRPQGVCDVAGSPPSARWAPRRRPLERALKL